MLTGAEATGALPYLYSQIFLELSFISEPLTKYSNVWGLFHDSMILT